MLATQEIEIREQIDTVDHVPGSRDRPRHLERLVCRVREFAVDIIGDERIAVRDRAARVALQREGIAVADQGRTHPDGGVADVHAQLGGAICFARIRGFHLVGTRSVGSARRENRHDDQSLISHGRRVKQGLCARRAPDLTIFGDCARVVATTVVREMSSVHGAARCSVSTVERPTVCSAVDGAAPHHGVTVTVTRAVPEPFPSRR